MPPSKALRFIPSASKYHNKRVEVDGLKFASKQEAKRYADLRLLEKIGEIDQVETQPRFPIRVNGDLVCTYVADFRYRIVASGRIVVEDVKSEPTRTPVYLLKKKLMAAVHGIEINEIE